MGRISGMVILVCLACMGGGCQGVPAEAEPLPPLAEGVVARVGSHTITLDEVDVEAAAPLAQLAANRDSMLAQLPPEKAESALEIFDNQAADVRSRTLLRMVGQRLIADEAARQGIEVEALVQREIDSKIVPVAEADVQKFYDDNKRFLRMPTPIEQMRSRIVKRLENDRKRLIRAEYVRVLQQDAGIRLRLDRPRFAIEHPDGTPSTGPADAPVALVEFADFECPACQGMFPVIKRLLREYEGRLRVIYRDFPLETHPRAIPAAAAAHCANEQGRFWEYHDHLMGRPADLGDGDLRRRAAAVGMDGEKFAACYESGRYVSGIEESRDQGRSFGVQSTPTLFVNGRILVRADYGRLKRVIEEELMFARNP